MVYAYQLRDGTGDERVASQQMIPADVLVGRRLSKPLASLPTYHLGSTGGPANSIATPNGIAIRIDDPVEARRVGATPNHYHLVHDFTPWHLNRALAGLMK